MQHFDHFPCRMKMIFFFLTYLKTTTKVGRFIGWRGMQCAEKAHREHVLN